MAKKALLDVLEQTIGKYVNNLDAESLNVAVWSGHIQLNSLELNCDAVNAALDKTIPFRVIGGSFDSFSVQVPWTHLMSKPVLLKAKGLHVSVEPYDRTKDGSNEYYINDPSLPAIDDKNNEKDSQSEKILQARRDAIKNADDYRVRANALKELAAQDLEAQTSASSRESAKNNSSNNSNTFGARLVRRIAENLQIEVSDIHIKLKGSDCQAGVSLDSLLLATTDANGKPTFVDRTNATNKNDKSPSFLHKLLELKGLGLYLDPDDMPGMSSFQSLSSIKEDGDNQSYHSHIMKPLSFQARLRQADDNECIDYPKYLLTSELKSVMLQLSKHQLELVRKIQAEIQPTLNIARPLFPEYRPLSRITKETAVDWWKYANRCIGKLNGKRGWVEFHRAFQKRQQYIPLYKRNRFSKECRWLSALTEAEKETLKSIEADRSISVEGIMTWRNIADAQVSREKTKNNAQQASNKGGLFSSLFGSKNDGKATDNDSEAPLQLSTEELKELESITLEQFAESEVSRDGQLCDAHFELGSLQIMLQNYHMKTLTTLQMGTVKTSLKAKADNSFKFDFTLSSLDVSDEITVNTLYPKILQNHKSSKAAAQNSPVGNSAFHVVVDKNSKGDQNVDVWLSTFEIVASPVWIQELSKFAEVSDLPPARNISRNNPLLTQSLSGSVDLFYDANEGVATKAKVNIDKPSVKADSTFPSTGNDLSQSLIDAWQQKKASKAVWSINLDVSAPIIVVPQNCIEAEAQVVVLDLGHLQFGYGNRGVAKQVQDWFDSHPTKGSDVFVDSGNLVIRDLTLMIGQVNNWRELLSQHNQSESHSIVEPISLVLNFAIESSDAEAVPRICLIGSLPIVSLRVSPTQIREALSVYNAWMKVSSTLSKEETKPAVNVPDHASMTTMTTKHSYILDQARAAQDYITNLDLGKGQEEREHFHIGLNLDRLTVKVLTEDGTGIEANLLSTKSNVSVLTSGRSDVRLTLGYFWVLDRFDYDIPRQRRLLVHSKLPQYLEQGIESDISHELTKSDFDKLESEAVSELADLSIRLAAEDGFGQHDPFDQHDLSGNDFGVDVIVDFKFSSLYLNWNPSVIKVVMSKLSVFVEFLGTTTDKAADEGIVVADAEKPTRRLSDASVESRAIKMERHTYASVLVRAKLESLNLFLHSAKDDMTLFRCSIVSLGAFAVLGHNAEVKLSSYLQNVTVSTCQSGGKTLPIYRTLLGLDSSAESQKENLLSVSYFDSVNAVQKSEFGTAHSDCQTYAKVSVSPVRIVYIHSQVLALVEYLTEGILNTLASQTTASTAAATEPAPSSTQATNNSGLKLFEIEVSSTTLLIPQSAYTDSAFRVLMSKLNVEYKMLPGTEGSVANVQLSDLCLKDNDSADLFKNNVSTRISANLPLEGVGSLDNQAMNISINMSSADLVLHRKQYEQVMLMLNNNVGNADLYLRDDMIASDDIQTSIDQFTGLTHSGAPAVEAQRRMIVKTNIASLSVELCRNSIEDSLISLIAHNFDVSYIMLPDQKSSKISLTLHDLSCDDTRPKYINRQHRSLVYQNPVFIEEKSENVISVTYETKPEANYVKVLVGAPCFCFIPDVIKDVLSVLTLPNTVVTTGSVDSSATKSIKNEQSSSTTLSTKSSEQQSKYEVSLDTLVCSLVLVDLGSDTMQALNETSTVSSASEVLVIRGKYHAKTSVTLDDATSDIASCKIVFDGDDIEIFSAFGKRFRSALQILDPLSLSVHGSIETADSLKKKYDLRLAALSSIDLSCSMKNIALVNAISSGISDALDVDGDNVSPDHGGIPNKVTSTNAKDENDSTSQLSQADSSPRMDAFLVKLTVPSTSLTIINDLQGIDDALMRISVQNFVAGGNVRMGEKCGIARRSYIAMEVNMHTSILADYFDSNSNRWQSLLLSPWELSLKGAREETKRFSSPRPSSTLDVESSSCKISFSDQFLLSLASVNQMWSMYQTAASCDVDINQDVSSLALMKRSVAASAARTFVAAQPYSLENHSGIDLSFSINNDGQINCRNNSIVYFRFDHQKSTGYGGKRLYGQDYNGHKSIRFFIKDQEFTIDKVDEQIGNEPRLFKSNNLSIYCYVKREGKTVVFHVSSGVDMINSTLFSFDVFYKQQGAKESIGQCNSRFGSHDTKRRSSIADAQGNITRDSHQFGIPASTLQHAFASFNKSNNFSLSLEISPKLSGLPAGSRLSGNVDILLTRNSFVNSQAQIELEVTMKDTATKNPVDPLGMRLYVTAFLVENSSPYIFLNFMPRAVLKNLMPLRILLSSPMPHIYTAKNRSYNGSKSETLNELDKDDLVGIYTPGPSVAFTMKCIDSPVGGTATEWMNNKSYLTLPLTREFKLLKPEKCVFPYTQRLRDSLSRQGPKQGMEFFVAQGKSMLNSQMLDESSLLEETDSHEPTDELIEFYITSCNFGIDHTGKILFENANNSDARHSLRQNATPFGAYRVDDDDHKRMSVLPSSETKIRALYLTMDGEDGYRRCQPFSVEDVSICNGGVESTPLMWDKHMPSGFFAYRRLLNSHQSEIHIVPEYVIYNGSKTYKIVVEQKVNNTYEIPADSFKALHTDNGQEATISVEIPKLNLVTTPTKVTSLGLKTATLKRKGSSVVVGTIIMQTVAGTWDSRLVIKIGHPKLNIHKNEKAPASSSLATMFSDDFVRLKLQWTSLTVLLCEASSAPSDDMAVAENILDVMWKSGTNNTLPSPTISNASTTWIESRRQRNENQSMSKKRISDTVCTIEVRNSVLDWQRVFKDEAPLTPNAGDEQASPERSQLTFVIGGIRVRDNSPNTAFPIVFDSSSDTNLLNFCVRVRGPINAELIRVDLLDVNFAYSNGHNDKIILSTSEDFVWKLLDIADRTIETAAKLAGFDIRINWDDDHNGYNIVIVKKESSEKETSDVYSPPQFNTVYEISKLRVSPLVTVVSFRRTPQRSRYKKLEGVRGASLLNYFTRRLKFTIDKAELKFARYVTDNIHGPLETVTDHLATVYLSRMKLKVVTILTAASFQDWKFLASRDGGDDEFVEGDLLRVAGNITGNTAEYVFKKAGSGLGAGISNISKTVGGGIQNSFEAVGAKAVGSGVNNVVTGVGDGVGETLTGIGSGAGKVMKGTGQGLGHIIGGVTGGALMIGKGLREGVTSGDGKAVASGVAKGVGSVGTGIGQGVESVVTGTAGGVLSTGARAFRGAAGTQKNKFQKTP